MDNTKYNILLSKVKEFFNVNDDLRSDLNNISLREHNVNLDTLISLWCKKNCDTSNFKELVDYLDMLNAEPHCISEMDEMYDFVYEATI